MKTTVELQDALYRQAKAQTALRGRKPKDLVEEGLRLDSTRRLMQRGIRAWRD